MCVCVCGEMREVSNKKKRKRKGQLMCVLGKISNLLKSTF